MSERTGQLSNIDVLDLVSERLGCDARIETGEMSVWIATGIDGYDPEPRFGIWSDILNDCVEYTTARGAVRDLLEAGGAEMALKWAENISRIVKEEVERFG